MNDAGNTAELISKQVEEFDGLPLGYMPAIILAVIVLICAVAWVIAKREMNDRDPRDDE